MKMEFTAENSFTYKTDQYGQETDKRTNCLSNETGTAIDKNTIIRDEVGTIDFTYYGHKARSLRSESMYSFFKTIITCISFRS
jgi:hypothetical protein